MRILVADDHPMIRTAIEVLLRGTDHEIVGTAGSGDETLRLLAEVRADLLLLDLQMPGGGGMEVLRRVKAERPRVRVVLLTAAIDDGSLMEAKALAVDGMVLKNADPAYLLECLDKVGSGGSWLDPELTARIQELSESLGGAGRPALAPRERELVRCVQKGLRNREIAKQLGVTEGTVKVYLHSVFEKLGVSSRTELAVRADEFLAESYLRQTP
jgi:two-component system, NarL family, nitrate/nitrite response regulator NarL